MYQLYRYDDDRLGEFVVISDDEEMNRSDYGEPAEVLEIDGDATTFPCDRPLRYR